MSRGRARSYDCARPRLPAWFYRTTVGRREAGHSALGSMASTHHEVGRPFVAGMMEMKMLGFVLMIQGFLLNPFFYFPFCLIIALDIFSCMVSRMKRSAVQCRRGNTRLTNT